jgi:hypothetical protein
VKILRNQAVAAFLLTTPLRFALFVRLMVFVLFEFFSAVIDALTSDQRCNLPSIVTSVTQLVLAEPSRK